MIDQQRIESFFVETKIAFSFLELQYNYKKIDDYVEYPNEWRDATAVSRYVGSSVGIEISWYFAGGMIGVTFVELLQPNVFPDVFSLYSLNDANVANAIRFYSLVEMSNTLNDSHFLLKDIDNFRKRKKRVRLIETNMSDILDGLAQSAQIYALDILSGDTSIFPKVMDYYLFKRKQLDPGRFIPSLKQQDKPSQ